MEEIGEEDKAYEAVGKARFMLAIAMTVLVKERSCLPVTQENFLADVQRILDEHFVPVDAALTITHSNTSAQAMMASLRSAFELAAPLVERAANQVSEET